MTTPFQTLALAAALAFTTAGTAATGLAAANPSVRSELSDHQLDRIVAGGDAVATSDGTGKAAGRSAQSGVAVTNFVRSDAPGVRGGAVGQATASATASPGALAVASSTLSLSVTLP